MMQFFRFALAANKNNPCICSRYTNLCQSLLYKGSIKARSLGIFLFESLFVQYLLSYCLAIADLAPNQETISHSYKIDQGESITGFSQ